MFDSMREPARRNLRRNLRGSMAIVPVAAIMLAVFLMDLVGPLQTNVAVLYIAVPLLTASVWGRRAVIGAVTVCAALAVAAFLLRYGREPAASAFAKLVVSLIAIVVATLLTLRDRSTRATLEEQARILELSHDTVIIRDPEDVILYWNDGAERLYGFTREEALGARCDALLHCDFPSAAVARSLEATGQWSGEMSRTRRDGSRIVLTSRWLQRRDTDGRVVGIMETSADMTEQKQAGEDRERSERRYSAIFHAAGFATWESDWSQIWRSVTAAAADVEGDLRAWLIGHPEIVREAAGKALIQDVNQAAIGLFEASDAQDLIGTSIIGRHPPGGERGFAEILSGLAGGADVVEAETQLRTLGGRTIDVILHATLVPGGEPWSRALVMAFDETERKEARARLEEVSAELAHAARISTLGQLAASIAHEVNQPLAAIVTYGKSGKRWLGRAEPDVTEVMNCLDHIVANASRAADVITRIRSLARKAAPQAEPLFLPELIDETAALVGREATAAGVVMRHEAGEDLPPVIGDRVQVQQVLVNLFMNAVQAMRDVEGRKRELCVTVSRTGDGMVRVAVQDCGSGIEGPDPGRIFAPFFTTRSDGMGMGLSICRSIIEAQGGRISAANNPGYGATIAFTLPARAIETATARETHTLV